MEDRITEIDAFVEKTGARSRLRLESSELRQMQSGRRKTGRARQLVNRHQTVRIGPGDPGIRAEDLMVNEPAAELVGSQRQELGNAFFHVTNQRI